MSDRSNFVDKADGDNIRAILIECQRNRYFRFGLKPHRRTQMLLYTVYTLLFVETSAPQEIL